jgi:hypothetical protein
MGTLTFLGAYGRSISFVKNKKINVRNSQTMAIIQATNLIMALGHDPGHDASMIKSNQHWLIAISVITWIF